MQVIHSDAIQTSPWADDPDHGPLTSPDRGPLPAFDQFDPFDELANGQTVRANRIPRMPSSPPRRPGLCRRLYCRAKARYLAWQLDAMRTRMDALETHMGEALELAVSMAKRHQHSPSLQARRRAMRADHTALAQKWLRVRQELDNLQAAL